MIRKADKAHEDLDTEAKHWPKDNLLTEKHCEFVKPKRRWTGSKKLYDMVRYTKVLKRKFICLNH